MADFFLGSWDLFCCSSFLTHRIRTLHTELTLDFILLFGPIQRISFATYDT